MSDVTVQERPGDAFTGLRVFDADTHFNEPSVVWTEYLDPAYRDAAPGFVLDNQGRGRIMIAGQLMPYIPAPPKSTMDKMPGASEPGARLADMDAAGIDVMAIFPTKGLFFFGIPDARVAAALCRAYNDWAADFCRAAPDRLIAPAVLPQQDIALMMEEARRSLTLGLRGFFIRPNPIGGRNLDHPALDPLWSLAEEAGVPVILHEGTTQDVPQVGNDRFDNFLYRHMVSHPFEQMMGLMALICGGVLERHPGLKLMISECGVGWAPYWLDRMDDHLHHWGHASLSLPMKPTEYFRRQVYVSAEGDERLLPMTVDALGDENFCFSTDYPHPDHEFHGVVAGIKGMAGLSLSSKRKILSENAARLFNF